jgi:hypothetical protein
VFLGGIYIFICFKAYILEVSGDSHQEIPYRVYRNLPPKETVEKKKPIGGN